MDKVQLEILELTASMTFNNTYALVLGEKSGNKRFSLVVGKSEAQAIALALDGLSPTRPLTHDLMQQSFQVFNIDVIEIIITNLVEGVFYAVIVCKKGEMIVEIDARTSDAIVMALRFNCPIYVNKKVLDAVGAAVDDGKKKKQTLEEFVEDLNIDENAMVSQVELEQILNNKQLDNYTIEELTDMMNKALEEENYEYAAQIRDELNKR